MTDLKRQLNEDRVLRETARSIVAAQFVHLRQGISGQRIGEKLADKVGEDAFDAFENAASAAKKNGGIILVVASLAAAALAWKPLTSFVQSLSQSDNDDEINEAPTDAETHAIEEQSDDA